MREVKFSELYKVPSCNGLSRPSAVRGKGYKMINMGELFSYDIINDLPMERVQMSLRELNKYLVEQDDLLFARQSLVASGAGKCSIVGVLTENTTFESHLIRVRLNKSLCVPKYYYYLFRLANNPIKSIVNQCAQAGIRGTELQKIKVSLPPLPTQQRIASILSAYDTMIENNNRRIRILEQMAENLYKEWFVRFRFPNHESCKMVDGLPEGWKVEKVKTQLKRYPFGRTYKEDELEKQGKVIVIDQSTSEYMGFHNENPAYEATSDYPYILFGDHSCKFVLMTIPFSLGENIIPFTGEKGVNSYYLFYALHNRLTTEEYKRHWSRLTSMKMIVPDVKLQMIFGDKIKPLYKQIATLQSQITTLTRQRDRLLPRLMSGQIEV